MTWRRSRFVQYAVLGLVNSAVVYLLFTPYVLLWVGLDWAQYVRWLEGGVVYSLMTGWLIALAVVTAKKRWFPWAA